jgi:hypothetical protein
MLITQRMGVGVAVVVTTFEACANPMEGSAHSATAIALLNAAATETTPKKPVQFNCTHMRLAWIQIEFCRTVSSTDMRLKQSLSPLILKFL